MTPKTTRTPLAVFGALVALLVVGCGTLLDVDFGAAHGADGGVVVQGPEGGACVPKSCADQKLECGVQNDGCGNTLDCGTCKTGVCKEGVCACVGKTCPDLQAECGTVDDGCGGALDCGTTCPKAGEQCVGNKCQCVPKTCVDLGSPECGTYPTGCGDTIVCGANNGVCPNGKYCDNGKCTNNPCTPKTCAALGNPCNKVSDGCGGLVGPCVTCTNPQTCGGGGVAGQCGCTKKTCQQAGATCGAPADGCGGALSCGSCTKPDTCGGGGTQYKCGCTPTGKCPQGADCGTVPDGCGGNVSCGPNCKTPQTCGGGGAANVCGCTSNGSCSNCCGSGTDNCGKSCFGDLCCGGGCFPAGSQVLMADGAERAIETLHAGDMVMTYVPETGSLVPQAVKALVTHDPSFSQHGIVVIDGTIRATPNHPMFTTRGTVPAGQIQVGDEIVVARPGAQGAVTAVGKQVGSVYIAPGGMVTYDLKVGGTGDMFIQNGVFLQKQ